MKLMKFKVKNPEHSAEIQNALFKAGYDWAWQANKGEVMFTESPWLFAGIGAKYDEDGNPRQNAITRADTDDCYEYEDHVEMFVVDGEIMSREPKFKVGDRVVCVDDDDGFNNYVRLDETYTVTKVEVDDYETYVYLDGVGDQAYDGFVESRFELAKNDPTIGRRITVDEMLDNIAKSTPGATQTITTLVDEYIEENKEPIGLRPKSVVDKERILEILLAMGRFVDAGKEVPYKWRDELEDLFIEENYVTK